MICAGGNDSGVSCGLLDQYRLGGTLCKELGVMELPVADRSAGTITTRGWQNTNLLPVSTKCICRQMKMPQCGPARQKKDVDYQA